MPARGRGFASGRRGFRSLERKARQYLGDLRVGQRGLAADLLAVVADAGLDQQRILAARRLDDERTPRSPRQTLAADPRDRAAAGTEQIDLLFLQLGLDLL